jgi:hypothetical protein
MQNDLVRLRYYGEHRPLLDDGLIAAMGNLGYELSGAGYNLKKRWRDFCFQARLDCVGPKSGQPGGDEHGKEGSRGQHG